MCGWLNVGVCVCLNTIYVAMWCWCARGIKIKCTTETQRRMKKKKQHAGLNTSKYHKTNDLCAINFLKEKKNNTFVYMLFQHSFNFNRIDAIKRDFFWSALLLLWACLDEWQTYSQIVPHSYCYYFIIILFELIWMRWYAYSTKNIHCETKDATRKPCDIATERLMSME